MALTLPTVPTGMKTGVIIFPCGVSIKPALAFPDLACKVNFSIHFLILASMMFICCAQSYPFQNKNLSGLDV
jgi:hypothetical protein